MDYWKSGAWNSLGQINIEKRCAKYRSRQFRYKCQVNLTRDTDILKVAITLEKHPRNYPMAAILKWHPDHRFLSSFFKIWRRKRIFDNSGIWTQASWIQGSHACHYTTLSYMNLWWKIWNTYSKQWKRRQNSNLDEGIHISVILMPFQYGRHWIVAWMLL